MKGSKKGKHKKKTAGGAGSRRRPKPAAARKLYTADEKREALEAYEKSGLTAKQFCKTWGVSPASLGKWRKAYREHGPKALESQLGVKKGKNRKPEKVRQAIRETKEQNPGFGLRKVRNSLLRFCGIKVSTGTISKELKEANLTDSAPQKRKKRSTDKIRRYERAKPGELWQSDITSYVMPRSGQRAYLVVFLDDHSRYVVSWSLAHSQTGRFVLDTLKAGIDKYGKPKEVLTDQGRQYFAWRGKSKFQHYLAKQGIKHVVVRSHHPQTVGKCERLWKTVGLEFWDRIRPETVEEARKRLTHFFNHFNFQRPHQGIDGLVPADKFFGSEDQVKQSIENNIKENELRMALGEAPKKPVYITGQIGDQKLSMHAEKGKLIIQTDDGHLNEIEAHTTELIKEKQNGNDGQADEKTQTHSEIQDATEGTDRCEGAVGDSDGSREETGSRTGHGDTSDVAGASQSHGDRETSGHSSAQAMAAQSASSGWDGRGSIEATQGSPEEGGFRKPETWGKHDPIEGENHETGKTGQSFGDSSGITQADACAEGDTGRDKWEYHRTSEERSEDDSKQEIVDEVTYCSWPRHTPSRSEQ